MRMEVRGGEYGWRRMWRMEAQVKARIFGNELRKPPKICE